MMLYSQCDWTGKYSGGSWPVCSKATCDADVVAFSGDGSGDANCHGSQYSGGMDDSDKNKYCCDQPEDDKQWKDYEWQGMTDVSTLVILNSPFNIISSICLPPKDPSRY